MRRALPIATIALLAGCAGLQQAPEAGPTHLSGQGQSCKALIDAVDAAVDAAGVHDASTARVPGFAYLRSDRFSASFRKQAAADAPPAVFETWVARLQQNEFVARGYEIRNLPAEAVRAAGGSDARDLQQKVSRCDVLLAREDLADPARRRALAEAAAVPDDYADWARKSPIYALASRPFFAGVEGWHKEALEMFRKAADGTAYARGLQRYVPEGPAVSAAEVAAILARTRLDVLGVPRPGAQDADTLLRAYAPIYEIETTGRYDRFGAMRWGNGAVPEVDVSRPVVYRRLAHTRYGAQTLLQLVYTVWFPERPAGGAFDLLAGKLDGLVFRVTLDTDGRPLVYDTIHPCGCYHMFFPTAALKPRTAPDPDEEWAFIPATLPAMRPAQRVRVHLASGSHYVVGVRPAGGGETSDARYGVADDNDLRSLPLPGGRARSVFGPDGLIAGSERPERLLFWPMGIESPGSMRQWGRQPTAFVGTRHFDDPDLIEKRFMPAPSSPQGARR